MNTDNRDDELLALLSLDDKAGPARRISREQSAAIIEQALDAWQAAEPPVKRSRFSWQGLAVAAAVLLALVGGASAARWYYGRGEAPVQVEQAKVSTPVVRSAPKLDEEPVIEPAVIDEQEVPERVAKQPRMQHERAEPEDLLQRANRLRSEGRFQAAADTYSLVYDRFPRTLSAYAAQVAAGSLQLEHLGKPLKARKLFETAPRAQPHGALDLEARSGLALALRDLGQVKEEMRVLRALIAGHPQSPAARRAEARLSELSSN